MALWMHKPVLRVMFSCSSADSLNIVEELIASRG